MVQEVAYDSSDDEDAENPLMSGESHEGSSSSDVRRPLLSSTGGSGSNSRSRPGSVAALGLPSSMVRTHF